MATPFAANEARLGAGTIAAFSNATAQILPSGPSIDGVFDRAATDSNVGAAGFLTRAVTFGCLTSDADAAGVAEATQLTIGTDTWEVSLRTDDLELGETELELRTPRP